MVHPLTKIPLRLTVDRTNDHLLALAFGHACRGTGDRAEALSAYEQALAMEKDGSFETDAAACIEELQATAQPPAPPTREP